MDPIKYIFEKPALTSRIARWQMLLSEYDIQYVAQKAIKGSILAYHLARQPMEDYQPLKLDFPNEDTMVVKDYEIPGPDEGPEPMERWTLMFDDASNAISHGVGAVLMSPKNLHLPFIVKLCFTCTNNMAKYEACILGLEEAIELRIKVLEVYGDYTLVIHQIRGDWEMRHANLIPYRDYMLKLLLMFDKITFSHIPREENQMEDALATLASMYKLIWPNHQPDIKIRNFDKLVHCLTTTEESDDKPWFFDIKPYLEKQEYLAEASSIDKRTMRRFASKFFLNGDVLYK
ncbi:uncharacterized protein LOC127122928 [Lathyrus oleraceus]|uniref:uncharacterized protein LOC127122928 n=1 Tax=Pisum sativum TaxID=3888 RepID=UPI0021D3B56E|nr:uncharacterized protein LOC127122928 [Pisum sativum]